MFGKRLISKVRLVLFLIPRGVIFCVRRAWDSAGLRQSATLGEVGRQRNLDRITASALHFAPRAKRVIFLFMDGGVSHVDSFDPKPELTKRSGQPAKWKA